MKILKIIRFLSILIIFLFVIKYFPQIQFDNSIERWIPKFSSGVNKYKEFIEEFGGDALIVIAFQKADGFEQKETKEQLNKLHNDLLRLPYINNVFKMPFKLCQMKYKFNERIYCLAVTFSTLSHLNFNRPELLEKI